MYNFLIIILAVIAAIAVTACAVCIWIKKQYDELKKQHDAALQQAQNTAQADHLTAIENALEALNAAISQINTQLTGLAALPQVFDQLKKAVEALDPGVNQSYTTLCEGIKQLREAISKLSARKRSPKSSKDKQQTAGGRADASGKKGVQS